MAHQKATQSEDVTQQNILGQHVIRMSQERGKQDSLRIQDKKALLRANQEVNALIHQQKVYEKERSKHVDIAMANLRNKRKLEIEERLQDLELKGEKLKNEKRKVDLDN